MIAALKLRRLGLMVLAIAAFTQVAAARATQNPEVVFGKFTDSLDRQITAAQTKLNAQATKIDAGIQKLINRDAPDAQIIKAVNAGASALAKSLKATAAGFVKSTLATKKTMQGISKAATKRGDSAAAASADEYVSTCDDFVNQINEGLNTALSQLESDRARIAGSNDPSSAYANFLENIESEVSDFLDSFS